MATDRETRSRKPAATRRRLRAEAEELERRIADDISEIYKPVEEWDWEELSHGKPRSKNGTFQGGKPKWITPALQAEIRRRHRELTEEELMSHASTAIQCLMDLMQDDSCDDFGKPNVPASVRVDCGKYIINHVIGTPTAKVEFSGASPLEGLMSRILVNPDNEPSHQVIEGTVVEQEPEEDDE